MELDIQEKVIKDRESRETKAAAKEALEYTNASTEPSSDIGKGKAPMEEVPQKSMEQQVKAYLHTSKQIKQRLSKITSALDSQEVTTSQPIEDSHVTTVVENTQSVLAQIEWEPLKWIQYLISFVFASTIDLTHSEEEDERVSPTPVTLEVGNGNDLLNSTNGSNDKPSSPPLQYQLYSQSIPSSSIVLI